MWQTIEFGWEAAASCRATGKSRWQGAVGMLAAVTDQGHDSHAFQVQRTFDIKNHYFSQH